MSTNLIPTYPNGVDLPPLPAVRAIASLAHDASLEMVARDLESLHRARDVIPAGSTVSVTWLPSDSHAERISAARALRDMGYNPVPHIAARRLQDGEEADRLIRELCNEAGVSEILLIGGDVAEPTGEFDSALELLGRLTRNRSGLKRLGFAGYPQGHPRIPRNSLESELDTKLAVAQDAGFDTFVVTQFAFEAEPILRWLQQLRARGHAIPVRIGLAGPATFKTLIRFASICGVGSSIRGAISHTASMTKLLTEAGPDGLIRHLAEGGVQKASEPLSLHFFTFGGLERAARWLAPVRKGSIRLHTSQPGFELLD